MLRPGSFRVFDLVSVSFEFRFCACVLSWVEILKEIYGEGSLYPLTPIKRALRISQKDRAMPAS